MDRCRINRSEVYECTRDRAHEGRRVFPIWKKSAVAHTFGHRGHSGHLYDLLLYHKITHRRHDNMLGILLYYSYDIVVQG